MEPAIYNEHLINNDLLNKLWSIEQRRRKPTVSEHDPLHNWHQATCMDYWHPHSKLQGHHKGPLKHSDGTLIKPSLHCQSGTYLYFKNYNNAKIEHIHNVSTGRGANADNYLQNWSRNTRQYTTWSRKRCMKPSAAGSLSIVTPSLQGQKAAPGQCEAAGSLRQVAVHIHTLSIFDLSDMQNVSTNLMQRWNPSLLQSNPLFIMSHVGETLPNATRTIDSIANLYLPPTQPRINYPISSKHVYW